MKNLCFICGYTEFVTTQILWPELCAAWELAPYEIEYINKQQGKACAFCGCNMRAQALALAIQTSFHGKGLFKEFIHS